LSGETGEASPAKCAGIPKATPGNPSQQINKDGHIVAPGAPDAIIPRAFTFAAAGP
jgi:hypothetical protein